MNCFTPGHSTTRRRLALTAAVVVVAGIAGVVTLVDQADDETTSPSAPWLGALPSTAAGIAVDEPDGVIAEAHGRLPDGVTVFDDRHEGITNLTADLRSALREAARQAASDGVDMIVNSGWRSPEYQERLRHDAVAEHGSEHEAARWVATSDTSPHVSGDAVDMGSEAAAWLSEHGDRYGLCQIYANEPWHFELRTQATDHGCPPMYVDPTHDPRMIADT